MNDLERDLSNLTTWEGETPELWRDALPPRRLPLTTFLTPALASAAVIVALLSIRLLDPPKKPASFMNDESIAIATKPITDDALATSEPEAALADAMPEDAPIVAREGSERADAREALRSRRSLEAPAKNLDAGSFSQGRAADAAMRLTSTVAVVELACRDVTEVASQLPELVDPALGESATRWGSAVPVPTYELRVQSRRLDDSLSTIRTYGDVVREVRRLEDFTAPLDQATDELYSCVVVEQDLMQLQNSRKFAASDEARSLDEQIGVVRGHIRRMEQSIDQFRQRAEFATIKVQLSPKPEPAETPKPEPAETLKDDPPE